MHVNVVRLARCVCLQAPIAPSTCARASHAAVTAPAALAHARARAATLVTTATRAAVSAVPTPTVACSHLSRAWRIRTASVLATTRVSRTSTVARALAGSATATRGSRVTHAMPKVRALSGVPAAAGHDSWLTRLQTPLPMLLLHRHRCMRGGQWRCAMHHGS